MNPVGTRAPTRVDAERGGATSVEMALVWVAILAFVLTTVQVGLVFLAGQLALTAAQDGLRAGRYDGSASTERAHQVAEDFLSRTAGTTLISPTVTTTLAPDGATLRVDVTGTVLSVVPGVELQVAKRAAGVIERPAP